MNTKRRQLLIVIPYQSSHLKNCTFILHCELREELYFEKFVALAK